jgi:RNA polymerase sigma-70 factor (ECF subfamily)
MIFPKISFSTINYLGYYKAMDFLRTAARHARLNQVYIQRAENAAESRPDDIPIEDEIKDLIINAVNQLPPQRKLIYQPSREVGPDL